MNKVKGIRVKLQQVIDSDSINAASKDWITPKKATILSNNSGTLVEAEEGGLYVVTVGDWFRSPFHGKSIPQVEAFNQLQDYGLTAIKDRIIRNEEKKAVEPVAIKIQPVVSKVTEIPNGQEIRSKNNVSIKKVDKAVAPNIKSEKKD